MSPVPVPFGATTLQGAYQWGKLDRLIFQLLQTMASISASRPPYEHQIKFI